MTAIDDWAFISRAPGCTVTLLAGRVGLRLSGEVDACNVEALERAVTALSPDAREIHLQLATLSFIDVHAMRELVALTRRPAQPKLILHYPPSMLLRLISLAWPEARAQFVISADRRVREDGRRVVPRRRFPEAGTRAFPDQSRCRPGPDIVELMRAGHQMILRLLEALYDTAGSVGDRRAALAGVWDQLADLVELYTTAEDEIVLLPVFGTGPQAVGQMREAFADHEDIREIVAEARVQPVGSPLWWELVKAAMSAWTEHHDREERGVLAALGRCSDSAVRGRLGSQWLAFCDAWVHDRLARADSNDQI